MYHGKQQLMAQVVRSLPVAGEAQLEFAACGFSLAWPQLSPRVGNTSGWEVSVYVSLKQKLYFLQIACDRSSFAIPKLLFLPLVLRFLGIPSIGYNTKIYIESHYLVLGLIRIFTLGFGQKSFFCEFLSLV